MSCDCYRIGGPWIDADPDCPEHGYEARQRAITMSKLEEENERLKQRGTYVVAFQHSGDSLFNADVIVHSSLEEACCLAARELDEPVRPSDADFDDRGRWLVSLEDIWCVIFKK